MSERRITFAISGMAILHGLVIWYLPLDRQGPVPEQQQEPLLDVVLRAAPPETLDEQPDEFTDAVAGAVEENDELQPEVFTEAIQPTPNPTPQPLPLNPDQAEPAEALVLKSHDDWTSVTVPAEDSLVATFRPQFYNRLESRWLTQEVSALLGSRRIERDGLPHDEYNAIDNDPSHIKTEVGCADLRSELAGRIIGPDGNSMRWWITACKGVFKSPTERPMLEYGDVGRVIGLR